MGLGLGLWRVRRFVERQVLGIGEAPPPPRFEIVTPKIRELAILDATRVAERFFDDFRGEEKSADQRARLRQAVSDFFQLYEERPIEANAGGSGFENLFWLYVTGRLLEPDLLVESGVWRGQSTWVLRQACPTAEIHAFDIDLSLREYVDESVEYHEGDWSDHEFGDLEGRTTLAFFDDHVNQKRRIEEARARGFDTLIFDDDLPVYHIHRENDAIVPTVDMLFDDDLEDRDEIEWYHRRGHYKVVVDKPAWLATRAMVRNYASFPLVDNTAETAATKARYGGRSKAALVTLL